MTDAREVSDQDAATIVAYVDGDLSFEETIAFEQRLSADPDLARALEEFLQVHDLQERAFPVQRSRSSGDPFRKTLPLFLLAAAAVLAVTWLGIRAIVDSDTLQFEVAVLPVGFDLHDYNEHLGLQRDRLPRENHVLRGTDPIPDQNVLTASQYLDQVQSAEERRVSDAFNRDQQVIQAGFFSIPLRPARECSAVVIQIADGSGPDLQYPPTTGSGWTDRRLPAQQVSYLPQASVLPTGSDTRVEQGERFRLTFVEGKQVAEPWIVALREQPIPEQLFRELEEFLASIRSEQPTPTEFAQLAAQAARVVTWVQEHGFVSTEFRVEDG